jgi:hypothetical protein
MTARLAMPSTWARAAAHSSGGSCHTCQGQPASGHGTYHWHEKPGRQGTRLCASWQHVHVARSHRHRCCGCSWSIACKPSSLSFSVVIAASAKLYCAVPQAKTQQATFDLITKGEPDLEGGAWKNVSAPAKDMLRRATCAQHRAAYAGACCHPEFRCLFGLKYPTWLTTSLSRLVELCFTWQLWRVRKCCTAQL